MPPPLQLTEAVADAICARVASGTALGLAAEEEGFTGRAAWKWLADGKRDVAAGVDSQQARFVQKVARARSVMGSRLTKAVLDGIEVPGSADAKAALSALKTFLPTYYGDRSLDAQEALELAADQPDASPEGKADAGAVAVDLTRCAACGAGTATDEGRAKWCSGCGAKLPGDETK